MESKNTVKMANNLFMSIVLISLCANIFVSLLSIKNISINIVVNLMASQMMIMVPGLIYYVCITKDGHPFKMYKKIKPLTVLLLIIFTWLILPLVSATNVFSQLFTKNEVVSISGSVLELPIAPMIFIIGVFGPFCEEFVFRGLIYNSLKLRSERYIASGIVSALFFGLMHMNLNQFCYAFVLGIVFAFINEILDSTWPSFICHVVINTQNVLLLYMMNKLTSDTMGKTVSELYNNEAATNIMTNKVATFIMFAVIFIVSIFTTTLAALLFYCIAHIEGKSEKIKLLLEKKDIKNKEKLINIFGYVAITVCIFVMFVLEPIINLIKK
ncbi:MAG: CPBP family intramembrane metalloprotease [Lachnospiraceae bacterium]|nr:CPBP family intramembrane metalloprotease [Lachnospiraceae bacterium]